MKITWRFKCSRCGYEHLLRTEGHVDHTFIPEVHGVNFQTNIGAPTSRFPVHRCGIHSFGAMHAIGFDASDEDLSGMEPMIGSREE